MTDTDVFEGYVREALEAVPEHLRAQMSDVIIVIEDRPRPGQNRNRKGLLLGLYEGVPLTEWGRDYNGKLPDKITIFRQSIEAVAESPEEIPRITRETVWHEVAHFFGFGHDKIHEMEKRWRAKERG